MQQPLGDGGCCSSPDTWEGPEGGSTEAAAAAAAAAEAPARGNAAEVSPSRTVPGDCYCVLLIHGSSSRRGGAHLNEDRLSVASWPVTRPPNDDRPYIASGLSTRTNADSSMSSLQLSAPTDADAESPSPAVSPYAHSGCTSVPSCSVGRPLQQQPTRLPQDLQQQQQQQPLQEASSLDWCGSSGSSPSSQPSGSLSSMSSPQWLGAAETPLIPIGPLFLPPLSAAAAAAASTPATPVAAPAPAAADGQAGSGRVCLRRPGVRTAYFSLRATQQQQQQQQPPQAVRQRYAAAVEKSCGCCIGSRGCRRVAGESKAAAAAAANAAATTATEESPVLSVDAALAALVEGQQLDPHDRQLQRRLCHAAAPCEGWGVSVSPVSPADGSRSAAAAPAAPAAATTAKSSSQQQQQSLRTEILVEGPSAAAAAASSSAAVTPARQQQQQQQQQLPSSCCSFLLSVFDGHDSEVAAEFASQALPLLAAKYLPQHITAGDEQQVAAAAAAAFAALDDSFRKRCGSIQRASGAACTSGCCALSAFLQGPHLFVFNLGDCRCAFLALGDMEQSEATPAAAVVAASGQQQPDGGRQVGACSSETGCTSNQQQRAPAAGPVTSESSSSSSSTGSTGKTSLIGHREVMRAVCQSSPSLRAVLKHAGADASAATSPDEAAPPGNAPAAVTWDQRPYTQLLPPPHSVSLPVSHDLLPPPAAEETPDMSEQERRQQGTLDEKPGWLLYGSSSSSMDCSTRSGSLLASGCSSSSCELQPPPALGPLSSAACRGTSSSWSNCSNSRKAAITFHWLSRDLRASAPYELQRLRSLNATVEGGRLGGVLEPSRTVGDFDIKDSQPKGALSTLPEAAYLRLTGPGLLLLASDGFWDFVGPGDILKCIKQVQSVWRPLVKTVKQSTLLQEQVGLDANAANFYSRRAAAASSSSCISSNGGQRDGQAGPSGSFLYAPTAAALSRLSDKLLRRAKRLGSEDDTTCIVAFLKPLFSS